MHRKIAIVVGFNLKLITRAQVNPCDVTQVRSATRLTWSSSNFLIFLKNMKMEQDKNRIIYASRKFWGIIFWICKYFALLLLMIIVKIVIDKVAKCVYWA